MSPQEPLSQNFRAVCLTTVPASVLSNDAAAAMLDTLVRFIKDGLRHHPGRMIPSV